MTYPGYAAGPPVHHPGPPVHHPGPPVHHPGPPVHHPGPPVHHPGPPVHHPGAPVYQPRGFYGHLDPEPPPPAIRVSRRSRLGSFATRLVAVVVGALVVFAVRSYLAGLDDPAVGDCVNATASATFHLVECGTAEAQFRIVGEEEGSRTRAEFETATDLCAGFPGPGVSLWEPGYRSESGTVYCAQQL